MARGSKPSPSAWPMTLARPVRASLARGRVVLLRGGRASRVNTWRCRWFSCSQGGKPARASSLHRRKQTRKQTKANPRDREHLDPAVPEACKALRFSDPEIISPPFGLRRLEPNFLFLLLRVLAGPPFPSFEHPAPNLKINLPFCVQAPSSCGPHFLSSSLLSPASNALG